MGYCMASKNLIQPKMPFLDLSSYQQRKLDWSEFVETIIMHLSCAYGSQHHDLLITMLDACRLD